jgi:hypothetical protein
MMAMVQEGGDQGLNESEDSGDDGRRENELQRMTESIQESLRYSTEATTLFDNLEYLMKLVPSRLLINRSDYEERYNRNSAFLFLHWEAIDTMKVSQIAAFSFRYSVGFSLLRNALETLIRGAFYNSIASKRFRNECVTLDAVVKLRKKGSKQKTSFREVLQREADTGAVNPEEWESYSAGIFGFVTTIQADSDKWRILPYVFEMLDELDKCGLLHPFGKKIFHDIYMELGLSTHIAPDYTDLGRRLGSDSKIFAKPEFISSEFKEYVVELALVMEFAMCLTFNVLRQNFAHDALRAAVEGILLEMQDKWKTVYFKQLCDKLDVMG